MQSLPLPILGKIAEYSRSTYDVNVTIIFNDDSLNTILQDVEIVDGYNVPIRFTVDFIIDFPNNNVRRWFGDLIRDIDGIPMPFNYGSIQNLENEIQVRYDNDRDGFNRIIMYQIRIELHLKYHYRFTPQFLLII